MNWRKLLVIATSLIVIAAAAGLIVIRRPDLRIRTATGAAADALCAKIFVSHLDPEFSFAEIMDRPGIRRLKFGMRYQLDRVAGKWAERSKLDPGKTRKEIEELLRKNTVAPLGGIAGVDLINVLEVNLALRDRYVP